MRTETFVNNWFGPFIRNFVVPALLLCTVTRSAVAASQPNLIEASRPIPQTLAIESQAIPQAQASGYCPSVGGSTLYESIASVQVNSLAASILQIVVDVTIANPTGCTTGNPCPEYDDSPEYINVWIDWDGDKVFEANEKVLDAALTGYININYSGTMTATTQVTIPPGAASNTYMRTNLGWAHDPNDPCEYSWTWGNVVDTPVDNTTAKVLKLETTGDDIAIDGVSDRIWESAFDTSGNLIDVIPAQPIADDMTSVSFTLKATIGAYPSQPTWTPTVTYECFINGVPGYCQGKSFADWNGTVTVGVPQSVGQYTLTLEFTISDDLGNIVTQSQTANIPLYVVYDKPLVYVAQNNLSLKKAWLDKATTWAEFAVGPETASLLLNNGIYTNSGWLYRDKTPSWWSLVENTASQGNCVSFSNAWDGLSKVLGVTGTSVKKTCGKLTSCSSPIRGFITKSATSLDQLSGNARPQTGPVDRWYFRLHQVGKLGPVSYYDPTFGNTYLDIFDFIEWHTTGNTGSDNFGPYLELTAGHKAYERIIPSTAMPWGEWEYHSPAENVTYLIQNDILFTGDTSSYGLDKDGTGLYNALVVEAEVDVTSPGDYSVFGVLKSGSQAITMSPSHNSMGVSGAHLHATQPGRTRVAIEFSGQDIYTSGVDGMYSAELRIHDSNGQPLLSRSFDTNIYDHAAFREIPVSINKISDSGEDADQNGFFEKLSVDVSITSIKPGPYNVSGYLSSGTSIMVGAGIAERLVSGQNIVSLKFDGQKIRSSGIDGPYQLHVSVSDGVNSVIKEVQTNSYSYTLFGSSLIALDVISDLGEDIDGDGYYEELAINIGVDVPQTGRYTMAAWLTDNSGEFIDYSYAERVLIAGSQSASISFDGEAIFRHAVDGPYVLNYLVVYDDTNTPVANTDRDAYATATYHYNEFQSPQKPLVQLTSTYEESGIDTDGDGTYDILRIQVEVAAGAKGNVIANGRLIDSSGEDIQWSSGVAYIDSQTPQMVTIDFDGRLIYANGKDGPYTLKNLNVYHTGDPAQNVYVNNAYGTVPYAYADFARTEIISGTVTGANGSLAGALISVNGKGFDYTNQEGKYHIAIMETGAYTVSIEGEGYKSWLIYVGGTYVGEGSSTDVYVGENEIIKVDFKVNQPPVANCQSVTVTTSPNVCSANGSVDNGSFDPDGDPITVVQEPAGPYPLGTNLVTLTVTDSKTGVADTCTATITVADKEAPSLNVLLSPDILWPPNHKMKSITATVEASDNCDSLPATILASVVSGEPDDGAGDGNTLNDIQGADIGTDDRVFMLRAERSGSGSARVYTVKYTAADLSGNQTTKSAIVKVPHDQ